MRWFDMRRDDLHMAWVLAFAMAHLSVSGWCDMVLDEMFSEDPAETEPVGDVGTREMDIAAPALSLAMTPKAPLLPPQRPIRLTLLQKARALMQQGAYEEALVLLDAGAEAHGGRVTYHLVRGYALEKVDRIRDAMRAYREAIRIEPDSALAYAGIGRLLIIREKHSLAERMLEDALTTDPGLVSALADLRYLKELSGRYGEALEIADRLVVLAPDDLNYRLERARLTNRVGSPARAIPELDAIVDRGDAPAAVYAERGLSYYQLKKRKEAVRDMVQALKLDSSDVATLNNLAWILATAPEPDVRNPNFAARIARKACLLSEAKDFQALDSAAAAAAAQGRFDTAVRPQRKAIALAPEEAHGRLQGRLELYAGGKALVEE
jgi:tetratricopeptide (TPR) repeat protein